MARIDVYLRSIRQLGAHGAVLGSGQAVTLRFAAGDRQATQTTGHDQLVALVREIAPPPALDQLDRGRPASFELDAAGARWSIHVAPRPGAWQVVIDSMDPAAAPPVPEPPARVTPRPETPPEPGDMMIERGPYAPPPATVAGTSGSALLDGLIAGARAASASDVYLSAGFPPFQRVAGELAATAERTPIDGDTLARELGLIAPNEARTAWAERGSAVFAYGDARGRVRVTLTRDHRGPGATLRLLPGEPPPWPALGLDGVADWLRDRGLVLVAGAPGIGKTWTLAALVRALGELRRRVIAIEDPIEVVHASGWISQRAVGEHVPGIAAGVAGALREGADAIVVGAVHAPSDAAAVVDAVAGGALVLATLAAPRAGVALDRLIDRLAAGRREPARALCADALLGAIAPIVARSGRSFDVVAGRRRTVG